MKIKTQERKQENEKSRNHKKAHKQTCLQAFEESRLFLSV
jgi:hypothetical protein